MAITGYKLTFDRIGRNHNVPAIELNTIDADTIAAKVWFETRKIMASREIEVIVDLEKLEGTIYAGFI